ncbi:MAG: hypothetical protein DWQ54_18385 [Microcystis flos-aquae TF09]|uniref:Uncharacterized protein n=1 Tax=Microcystis flos-aquae TF09 TaxID=2060473 RepID=A0A3E0KYY2_9CHRO|nr:MAG: hypothetical protein DWQ54_18385 [Microcystis flos-aquae TF09]
MTPLIQGDPPAYRHPPYQGGQGESKAKSIFNLIINDYLFYGYYRHFAARLSKISPRSNL